MKVKDFNHAANCECDNCRGVLASTYSTPYSTFTITSVEKLSTGWWVKFKMVDVLAGVSYHNWPLDFWNREAEKYVTKK